MGGAFVSLLAQYRTEWWHLFYLNWCVFGPQRRPGSLSTDAGGPMGVLGISGSVGIRRRVLYI